MIPVTVTTMEIVIAKKKLMERNVINVLQGIMDFQIVKVCVVFFKKTNCTLVTYLVRH